jgi:hypothetical protein
MVLGSISLGDWNYLMSYEVQWKADGNHGCMIMSDNEHKTQGLIAK